MFNFIKCCMFCFFGRIKKKVSYSPTLIHFLFTFSTKNAILFFALILNSLKTLRMLEEDVVVDEAVALVHFGDRADERPLLRVHLSASGGRRRDCSSVGRLRARTRHLLSRHRTHHSHALEFLLFS